MSSTRQLAAIMFTDIVGYTALMGSDEQKAFQLLKKNRQIQQPLIKQYNGTWIKELGDGVLASFHTVTDAVMCAAAIHKACTTVEGLMLRIGIHLGEVVFEDHDVFGDGVNIASRLQALAPIGGTFVSEAVYKNVSNKKEFITEFIREENLKNVSEPVKIYEIKVEGVADYQRETLPDFKKVPDKKKKIVFGVIAVLILIALLVYSLLFAPKRGTHSAKTIAGEKSIAVLPFKNMSEEKENQHFTDGMMDEILNKLSKIKEFRVISRTSVEQYRGTNKKMNEIAKELGVAYILEGSAQKYGDEIKVTAQLIQADAVEQHLWSENYTKPYKEVFALQTEIANSIANELQAKLTPQEHDLINKAAAANLEAYDLYLRGKEYIIRYWEDDNENNLASARILFQSSLDADSQFAKAWAGLGIVYYHGNQSQVQILSENYLDSVLYFCTNALSYDNKFPEAYWMIGRYYHNRGNSKEAITNFKRAVEIDPNHINSNWNLAKLYHSNRDYAKALYYFKKVFLLVKGGAELPNFYDESSAPYLSLGNFEIVDSLIGRSILLRPGGVKAYGSLVRSLLVQGKMDKALAYARKMFDMDPSSSIGLRSL